MIKSEPTKTRNRDDADLRFEFAIMNAPKENPFTQNRRGLSTLLRNERVADVSRRVGDGVFVIVDFSCRLENEIG